MASWKKTITTPFKKLFNQQQSPRDNQQHKKPSSHHGHPSEHDNRVTVMDLQGEVMACGYEDVQVMWSMLDKTRTGTCTLTT